MKELKLTENKIGSILYAVAYFGLMIFIKFSGDILLKLFPVEFLVKYFDPLIYAIFFVAAVICFRKIFGLSMTDFKENYKKYLKWSICFYFLNLVLVGIAGMILTAAGVDKSINQSAVEWAIEQNKILYALTTCILGPVVEEVIYRGIIFNALAGEKNNTKRNVIAVILTALIFAIMHVTFVGFNFYDLLANLPVFMIGLTVTLMYLKTGNILCPILVHMVINTISVIAQSVM